MGSRNKVDTTQRRTWRIIKIMFLFPSFIYSALCLQYIYVTLRAGIASDFFDPLWNQVLLQLQKATDLNWELPGQTNQYGSWRTSDYLTIQRLKLISF